jgi:hypothetical protein
LLGTGRRSLSDDFGEWNRHQHLVRGVGDLKRVLTNVTSVPNGLGPHLGGGLERLQISGLDIRQLDTFVVALDSIRGTQIKEKERHDSFFRSGSGGIA